MKRRQFVFRSLKTALLFNSVLNIRLAEAQVAQKMRAFFFVCGGSYPRPEEFFPNPGNNGNFNLPPILADFEGLKNDMVVLDGVNIRDSGPRPRGNNHVRAMGKVLTAKDVIQVPGVQDGVPGGASVDQLIADSLGVRSAAVQVSSIKSSILMRSYPFATAARQFKVPSLNPAAAWDDLFGGFQPPGGTPLTREESIRKLSSSKSLMDDIVNDLKRFGKELVGDEKIKLDATEDAIRKAEISVSKDITALNEGRNPLATCTLPERISSRTDVPRMSDSHFDIMYAALLCNRIGVGSMIFGYSSIQWRYEWLNLGLNDNIHDAIYHRPTIGNNRDTHNRASRWNWDQLRKFAERLKATPDGASNMLDNTMIYATSHFGNHHRLERIPVLLLGNAQNRLQTGRVIKLNGAQSNAKSLTLAAQLCGVNISGIGDEPNSGPIVL